MNNLNDLNLWLESVEKQKHSWRPFGLIRAWTELKASKHLIWSLSVYQVRNDNRDRILGNFWGILDPLFRVLIFTIVVTMVFNKHVPAYPAFMYCGSIFFRLFVQTFVGAPGSLVSQGGLIKSTSFPKIVIPAVYAVTQVYYSLIELPVLILIMALFKIYPSWHFLLAVPLTLIVGLSGFGMLCLLAPIGARYRDLSNFLSHVGQLFFYMSPVLYPITFIPERFRDYYMLNPLAVMMETARDLMIRNTLPPAWMWFYLTAWTMLGVVIGLRIFYEKQTKVAKLL